MGLFCLVLCWALAGLATAQDLVDGARWRVVNAPIARAKLGISNQWVIALGTNSVAVAPGSGITIATNVTSSNVTYTVTTSAGGTNTYWMTNGVAIGAGSAGTVNWTTGVTGSISGAVATLGVSVTGAGEVNVNGEQAVTNATRFGWVYGKSGVTNLLRSLEPGWGLAGTNQGSNIVLAADSAVLVSHTVLNTASNALVTYATSNRVGVYRTLAIPSWAFQTNVTEGASLKVEETSTNKKTRDYMEFGDSTTNGITISFPMPELWDRGNIEAKVYWGSTNAGSNQTNVWELAVDTADDSDALDGAYGSVTVLRDKVVNANDMLITAASGSLTFGNSPGAAGAVLDLRVRRLPAHADDTLGGVAKLYAVVVRYLETATEPGSSW